MKEEKPKKPVAKSVMEALRATAESLNLPINLLNISNYLLLEVAGRTLFRILEGNIMTEKETRNFALRDSKGNEIGVFAGKAPRQAALKAANRGHTDIKLRERGTKRVHIFTGERKQVKKPKGAPEWMPAKIWKPFVKKVGIENLEEL